MREGVDRILREIDEEIHTVGERTLEGAVSAIGDGVSPDLVVLDLVLPDGRGDALVDAISTVYPISQIVAYSGQEDAVLIRSLFYKGLRGYILKSGLSTREEFERVIAGERSFPPIQEPVDSRARSIINSEDIKILRLVADPESAGSIKSIARTFDITERMAKRKWLRVRQKLEAKTKTQALARARQMGILHD